MLAALAFPWWLEWNHVGTPLIAIIATYIAIAQFAINRRQYRLALFEQRMAIFNPTAKFIAAIVQTANVTLDECMQFIRETKDHEFLFGKEVGDFITEVYKQAAALETAKVTHNLARETEILTWFSGQIAHARKVFGRYLDFRKP